MAELERYKAADVASKVSSTPSLLRVPSVLQRQIRRVQKGTGFFYAFCAAYVDAYRIGVLTTPNNADVMPTVKKIARMIVDKVGITIQAHGDIPNIHSLRVSNHVSWLDPVVFSTLVPATFIAKAEVANWPLMGQLVKAAGTVFIKRGSGDSASVSDQIAVALQNGSPVMFFPEATTTNGRYVHKIHGKLLAAALTANTPVQPMVILYQGADGQLDRVVPWCGDDTFIANLGAVFAHTGVVAHIQALEPISPEGHTRDSLTVLLKARMDEGFNQLHREVFGRDAEQPPS